MEFHFNYLVFADIFMPEPAYIKFYYKEKPLQGPLSVCGEGDLFQIQEFEHRIDMGSEKKTRVVWQNKYYPRHSPLKVGIEICGGIITLYKLLGREHTFLDSVEVFWTRYSEETHERELYFKQTIFPVKIHTIILSYPNIKDSLRETYNHLAHISLRYRYISILYIPGFLEVGKYEWPLFFAERAASFENKFEIEKYFSAPALTDALALWEKEQNRDFCDPGAAPPVDQDVPAAEQTKAADEKEFSVKVVDENKNPLAKVSMVFTANGQTKTVPTGGDGVAKWKVAADSATVTFEDADALGTTMKPIWTKCNGVDRKDWVQEDSTTTTVTLFGGEVVKAVADKSTTGTTRPKENLEPFFGIDASATKPGETPDPVATLSVQPLVIVVRMLGEHFDIDKCFLLPKALSSIQELVRLHKEYSLTDLLIVGHADTHGAEDYNLDLSLERTSSMRAYLKDDADSWLKWYGEDKKQSKRWGETEDNYMIATALEGTAYPTTVPGYQQWHNAEAPQKAGYAKIKEDGKIGPETRRQLVLDYMHREDTTVPADVTIKVHGCGEFFPLDSTGEALDTNAADEQYAQEDRRVEVYLFPRELGMLPPVPGDKATKTEKEYAEWRAREVEIENGSSMVLPWTAHWEKKIDPATGEELPAKMGESRKMILSAPGLAAGLPVIFTVYQVIEGGADQVTETKTVVSAVAGASAPFDEWYNPDLVQNAGSGALPKVDFRFEVQVATRMVPSNILPYRDKLEVRIFYGQANDWTPPEQQQYGIHSPWGQKSGQTVTRNGELGWIEEPDLPPGGVSVVLGERVLMGTNV